MNCPKCNSLNIVKNGSIHNGKQKFQCKDCGRQFVENPTNKVIPRKDWELVDKLLWEKIPIAGISRVTGISESWLRGRLENLFYDKDLEHGVAQHSILNVRQRPEFRMF